MVFSVGDTVVHPHHGAAIIERTEQRDLRGRPREYLVLRVTCGELTLMVPADACERVGIRPVMNDREVEELLTLLRTPPPRPSGSWSRRFKANRSRLRSGDLHAIADVIRRLGGRPEEDGLSAGERRMLDEARRIVLSELAAATATDTDQAAELVDGAVAEARVA